MLWSGTEKAYSPIKLRHTICKFAPRFNGCQQHDAQEFLAVLLDGLHEDLNRGVCAGLWSGGARLLAYSQRGGTGRGKEASHRWLENGAHAE